MAKRKRDDFNYEAACKRIADLIPYGNLALVTGPEAFFGSIEEALKASGPIARCGHCGEWCAYCRAGKDGEAAEQDEKLGKAPRGGERIQP